MTHGKILNDVKMESLAPKQESIAYEKENNKRMVNSVVDKQGVMASPRDVDQYAMSVVTKQG